MLKSSTLARRTPFLLLFLMVLAFNAIAQKTWVGPGNWSTPGLWSPAGVPATTDSVIFDGSSGNCTLDVNATVLHMHLRPTFTGSFTQGAHDLTISRTAVVLPNGPPWGLIISAGTFNASATNLLTIQGSLSIASPAMFLNHGGRVSIKGAPGAGFANVLTGNATFSRLDFNSLSDVDIFTIDPNTDLTVLDTLSKSGLHVRIYNGDIYLKGNLMIYNVGGSNMGAPWGDARIFLDGTADQYIVGKQATYTQNFIESIIINKTSGTVHYLNYITSGRDWYLLQGTVDPGTSTVFFYGQTQTIGGPAGVPTKLPFYDVRFNHIYALSDATTVDADDTVVVNHDLIWEGANNTDVYDGYIFAKGDITVTNFPQAYGFCGGDANIVINGTGDQLFWGKARRNTGYLPNIVIDKPSGTLTLKDTIVVERSWKYIRGNVDATTQGSYVSFVRNESTYNMFDEPQTIDGEGTVDTMLFDNVSIDNPVFLAQFSRDLAGALRVKNDLVLRNHLLRMNGHDILMENSNTAAIQHTTGWIISETQPPAPGISRIHWFIDEAPNGNSYIFPFGTATSYIPFTLTVTTPGVSPGTSVGSVSVATYATNTDAIPNNRPLPPGVTNINSFIGNENSTRELDRYWVYECYNYTTTPTTTLLFKYLDEEWNTTGNDPSFGSGPSQNDITESLLRPHQWNSTVWGTAVSGSSISTAANIATAPGITSCSTFTLFDPTLPDLIFLGDDTTICVGDTVHFHDVYTTAPSSRTWFFPGGTPNTSTAATPAVVYSAASPPAGFDVILWATYPGGTLKDTLFGYISVTTAVSASVSHHKDITCNGDDDGEITISATGGSGVYHYTWNDTTLNVAARTDLPAAIYTVLVEDNAGGCSSTVIDTIIEPAPLAVTFSNVTNTLCSAACNGGAKANPTGGTGPYTYKWLESGETTQTAVALCADTNHVAVTDAHGCKDTVSVIIVGSPAVSASISSTTPASCHGVCDGTITVSASGGNSVYTYNWSCSNLHIATVTGVCAGTCTVTVTDGNNCTASATTTVTEPAALTFTTRGHDITCNGLNNGTAKVIPSGGTGPYTSHWSAGTPLNPPTNDTVTGLPPGVVHDTIKDSHNCTVIANITINQPAVLVATGHAQNVTCNGGNNGKAWVTITGGTPGTGYHYTWLPANIDNDTITGLIAGTYTVTVTDAHNCTDTAVINVTQPAAMVVTLAKSDVRCLGGNDGCAWITNITGGTAGFTYIWNNGATTDSTCGFPAGTASVTVTDANNCTASASIAIGQPATGITLMMHKTDISCFGLNDGSAWVDVAGGVSPYIIAWEPGAGTVGPVDSIRGLHPGFVSVTVSDNNSCSRTDSVQIIEPALFVVTLTTRDISCFGANNGRGYVTLTGGTPPYSGQTWNPPVGIALNDSIFNLPPGALCVQYTDAHGCVASDCDTIVEPADITLTMDSTAVTCHGSTDGHASVTAGGGPVPGTYTYLWSRGTAPLTNSTVNGLAPGPVTVTVTSGVCSKTGVTTINEPAAMGLTLHKRDISCNGSRDGMVSVVVTGGSSPYNYLWSDGVVSPSGDTTSNLGPGSVCVTVTDNSGCTATACVTINEPAAITITQTVTPVTCPGGSDGAINILVSGGSGTYTSYRWSNGFLGQNLVNVPAGFYTVIVTDDSSCTGTESYTLQEGVRFEVTANVINAACGSADGEIDVSVVGGSGNFTYAWAGTSLTTQDRTGLSGGTYTVSVHDVGSNCTQAIDVTLEDVGGPTLTGAVVNSTNCSSNDGTITVTATGGIGPYLYHWSHDALLTGPVASGLDLGEYTVTVTDDSLGCMSVSTFTVGAINGISLSGAVTNATCGANDGGIVLTVSTGTSPYTFTWSNGATTQNISSVGAGTYSVTVNDSKGCTGDKVFTVSEGGPAVSGAVVNVSCFGGESGSVTLTVVGNNTFNWSTGAITKDVSSLKPGIYTVTVSDTAANCSTIKDFTITEPAEFTLTADRSNVSCNGFSDGWITVYPHGGTAGYTYIWTGPGTFASTSASLINLVAGDYHVTATDTKGCTTTLKVTLTEASPLILTMDMQPVSCGGDTDGRAWVVVTGGAIPFDYSWSAGTPIGAGDTVINLLTGNVRVTVTDANGCSAADTILVTEPVPLTLTISKTNITCFGDSNGTATAVPGGGTPGYTYAWSNGDTTVTTTTPLAPGPIIVTVTDAHACSISDTATIVEPAALATVVTKTDVTCFGDSNGTAHVAVTGGRTPYGYNWDGGDAPRNLNSVSGLFAGMVHVTVTDSSGCAKVDSILIGQPATAVSVTLAVSNVSCFGGSNGTITATATGGTPGYDYDFGSSGTQGATENIWTQLAAGQYIVTVTDTNGCTASTADTATITEPTQIAIVTSKLDISCFGAHDGKVFVDSVSGGTPHIVGAPYTFAWSGSLVTADSITGLGPGLVTVTVTDSLLCTATSSVTILEPNEILLNISKVDISCFGLTDGTAHVDASGGTPGFTYVWTSGTYSSDSTSVTDLGAGADSVFVTDSRGCTDTTFTTIIEPDSIHLTIAATNVLCFGDSTGTAVVTTTGGTPTYDYFWSGGSRNGADSIRHHLLAGAVTVTVVDARACRDSISTTITQPASALAISLTKTDVSCFGGNDGTVTITTTGGTAPYSYNPNPGVPGTSDSIRTQLPTGDVPILVTDFNACTVRDTITLIQPAELLLSIAVDSNASCHGGTDGGLTLSLTGGVGPYDYDWSAPLPDLPNSPLTSNSVNGLGVGNYTVIVTDSHSCTKQISQDIVERAGPQIAANGVVLDRPTCHRQDGGICITATTTDNPLTIVWSPSGVPPVFCPTGLAEGAYTATITDRATCDTVLTIDLQDVPGPSVDFVKIKDSYCDDNDGQATAVVTGGVTPYDFTWVVTPQNDSIGNDSIITGLVPGTYSLIVADANVCDTQINFQIVNIASPNVVIAPVSPQTIFNGDTVGLVATVDVSSPLFAWTANPENGFNSLTCTDCANPTANPKSTTTYELIVVDSSTQCSDTAYMTIVVKDEKNIFVPNVITPNGDGVNDVWRITELQEIFRDNEVAIVNRWGDEIFREKNYQNKFDGTYKNEKLPDGTYYYIIKLNDIGKTVTGPLTIISE